MTPRTPAASLTFLSETANDKRPRFCMIFGPPGSGKSTLVRSLTRAAVCEVRDGPGFRYAVWNPRTPHEVAELGLPDDDMGFRGSDRLRLNVATDVYRWLETWVGDVLVEGDRLTTGRMVDVARKAGFAIEALFVHVPQELLEARRAERYAQYKDTYRFKTRTTTGPPNETWVKGRETKAVALAERLGAVLLDGAAPPHAVAAAACRASRVCLKLARRDDLSAEAETLT